MKIIDNHWDYISRWTDDFLYGGPAEETVRLPHTVKILPLHDADSNDYQGMVGYRKTVEFDASENGRRQFLQFDGAAHIAEVYFNEKKIMVHKCGYTGFRTEITDLVMYGEKNTIVLKLDTSENPSVPPFGFVIDYLTYGGIYRDVKIDSRPYAYIEDAFLYTPDLHTLHISLKTSGTDGSEKVHIRVLDQKGNTVTETEGSEGENEIPCGTVSCWTPESPVLYTCEITLAGKQQDVQNYTFGFRTISTDENNILLNGQPYFLRGLNRHQCWPYAGYAMPASLQKEDARILKEELGVNAVRTSHYPQSHDFLDACDSLGILVFTEIPGWQHIGDSDWKKQAMINTEDMVKQYRNHTSIVLWGVRINESQDDDELYRETNRIAHTLDPTRPTSGVRYFENSSLLEDVYSYNDFSHDGKAPGCRRKQDVTKEKKPLLITESNGHMFPTKSCDRWERRQEHALRHARVMDSAMKDHEHAGVFQWCMFDYPTHRDFGSGDRICYHGVMDSFRNPKLAAAFYASQSETAPVLEIGSSMDIGDYDGGHLDTVYAFTNCDEVKLYRGNDFVKSFVSQGWKGLKHGPVKIDDLIGELLESRENLHGKQEKLVHDALLSAQRNGNGHLPLKTMMQLGWCMIRYGMKYSDGVSLYGKYVGGWGGEQAIWKFVGIKNSKPAVTVIKAPGTKLHLEVKASSCVLHEGSTYDAAAFRIRVLDEYNNTAVYAQLPVSFKVSGPLKIIGPDMVSAEGGMCGTYLKTVGKEGTGTLTVHTAQTEDAVIEITVKGREKL
jgi:beta-galactosidase